MIWNPAEGCAGGRRWRGILHIFRLRVSGLGRSDPTAVARAEYVLSSNSGRAKPLPPISPYRALSPTARVSRFCDIHRTTALLTMERIFFFAGRGVSHELIQLIAVCSLVTARSRLGLLPCCGRRTAVERTRFLCQLNSRARKRIAISLCWRLMRISEPIVMTNMETEPNGEGEAIFSGVQRSCATVGLRRTSDIHENVADEMYGVHVCVPLTREICSGSLVSASCSRILKQWNF